MRPIGSSMADTIPVSAPEFMGAWAEWLLGYPEKALASIAEGLALAERIAHPFTLGCCSHFFLRRFTSIAASQSEPCANSMPPRRWLRSSGSR